MANKNGTNGNDSLPGTASNDIFTPLRGIDTVDGVAGSDTLIIDYSKLTGNIGWSWNYYTDSRSNSVTFYNIERFNVTTGSGDDSLVGNTLGDTLSGGAGYDMLTGGGGADNINGGIGVDTWKENYSAQSGAISVEFTPVGNASGDVNVAASVSGSTGISVKNVETLDMQTGSGNDSISVDTLAYSDNIVTGSGNDTINVGLGGNDYVDGGLGSDLGIFDWSASTASITVNYYDDYTDGEGRAVNFDNIERFSFTGGSGDDSLQGHSSNDTLLGGEGRDTLNGGAGTDSIDGGNGIDTWIANYNGLTGAINIQLKTSSNEVLGGISGTSVTNIEQLQFTAGSGNDNISTAPFANNDTVYGGGGDDTINVGIGGNNDYVDGGVGRDAGIFNWGASTTNITVNYYDDYTDGAGRFVNFDNIERFNLTGGSGDDYLVGHGDKDILIGGSGSDTLNGAGGKDKINGGSGIDQWRGDYSSSTVAIKVQLNASALTNEVVGGITGATVGGIERLDFTSGSGNDIISMGTFAYDDTVRTGGGDDQINVGTGGNDYVDGGEGIDVGIFNWSGATTNIGVNYYDDYTDGVGRSVNFDNVERFNLIGGFGDDSLQGDAWNDTLIGGDGRDTLDSGTLRADVSMSNVDSINGGDGVDLWVGDYSLLVNSVRIQLVSTANANEVLGGITDGVTSAVVKNIEALGIRTGTGNDIISSGAFAYDDNIRSGDGDDVVNVGTGGHDYVDGADGIDTGKFDWSASTTSIMVNYYDDYNDRQGRYVNFDYVERFDFKGGSGNDSFVGHDYTDTFSGGAGDDTLDGYGGDDFLTGGVGNDLFYVRSSNGNDVITDFAPGQGAYDQVYFNSLPFVNTDFPTIRSHMTQKGSNVVLALTETDSITFQNTTVNVFSADDFWWG